LKILVKKIVLKDIIKTILSKNVKFVIQIVKLVKESEVNAQNVFMTIF